MPLTGGSSNVVTPAMGFGDLLVGVDAGNLYVLTLSTTASAAGTLGYVPLAGGTPPAIGSGPSTSGLLQGDSFVTVGGSLYYLSGTSLMKYTPPAAMPTAVMTYAGSTGGSMVGDASGLILVQQGGVYKVDLTTGAQKQLYMPSFNLNANPGSQAIDASNVYFTSGGAGGTLYSLPR